jgi:hypothetical protein
MRLNKEQLMDIVERALFTYVQTFLGLLSASGLGVDMGGLSTLKMAALGGLPAAISVIKGALCTLAPIGDETASVIRQKQPLPEDGDELLYE